MTKQEFETLTGMAIDDKVFDRAETIYLNAGSLTKEEFCNEIKLCPWLLESETVFELATCAQDQTNLAAKQRHNIGSLKEALLDACIKADDESVWRSAKDLIGPSEVICYKIEQSVDLDRDDLAYIKENLPD